MGNMTKYDRLNIDIQGLRQALEELADQEQRSLSNFGRTLIIEALTARGINVEAAEAVSKLLPTDTIHSVVERNMNKLKRAGLKNLRTIADGEVLPTPENFLKIAALLELSEPEQRLLWNRTFAHYPSTSHPQQRSAHEPP